MLDIKSCMESFKQSICKRLERHEEMFYGIDMSQSECKRRLKNLEMARQRSYENEDIVLQHVKSFIFFNP